MASRCSCQLSPLVSEAELDHRCPVRSFISLMGGSRVGFFGVAEVVELHAGNAKEKVNE